MKNLFLKFKSQIAKAFLSILGFTLAASQCLAQYMAIRPQTHISLHVTGIADTISRFRLVVNDYDTLYSSWENKYLYKYRLNPELSKIKVEISEDSPILDQRYEPVTKIIGIKPEEENQIEIELKAKE